MWAKTAMALPCMREARAGAYGCCGLWVAQGAIVHFSEDDTTGAVNDTSAQSPSVTAFRFSPFPYVGY